MSEKTEHELAEVGEDERRVLALKQKRELSGLTAHPGWHMLRAFAEAQIKGRTDQVMLNTVTEEKLGEQNFLRGEAAGMRILLKYVDETIKQAEDVLGLFREPEEGQSDEHEYE